MSDFLLTLSISIAVAVASARIGYLWGKKKLDCRQVDLNGWIRIADDRLCLAIKFAAEVAALNKELCKWKPHRNDKGRFLPMKKVN